MKRIVIIGILLSFGLGEGISAFGVPTAGPHGFTPEECARCHSPVPADGQSRPFPMTAPVAVLCKKCHTFGMESFSHPVGFRPQRSDMPPDFPLSYDGTFTCSTCHDFHSETWSTSGFRLYNLRGRGKYGQGDFCAKCHEKKPFSHETLLTAHMKKRLPAANPSIDEISAQCLACHDGFNAKAAGVSIASPRPFCFCPEEKTGHSIGVDYESARGKTHELKPAGSLRAAVKLFDGKVGCGSCHDPYSKNRKMLVVPMTDKNNLCVECHIK